MGVNISVSLNFLCQDIIRRKLSRGELAFNIFFYKLPNRRNGPDENLLSLECRAQYKIENEDASNTLSAIYTCNLSG